MFFASGRLMPTLPPTELSTWAKSEVGTWRKREPAGVGGGDEAGQIADHAAADGRHDGLAIGAQFEQALPQAGGHVERLALLARLDGDHVDLDVLLAKAFGHAAWRAAFARCRR